MTEETIRCDRCKKVIDGTVMNVTLFRPKVFICRFSDRADYYQKNHDLCYACWKNLINWFNEGVTDDSNNNND